jgi:23S rRNA (uridine2552-2'-O)-methyltransferase
VARRNNPYVDDAHTRQAKADGYPARSVYKLAEIDQRVGLFRGVRRVLDLGAAPGSWSLYAAERVGPQGVVLAIDLKPIPQAFPANVQVAEGDALVIDNEVFGRYAPYDLVMSDMAPNTMGSKLADQARSFELFERALQVALAVGGPRSSFVGKLFMSNDFVQARDAVSAAYSETRVVRPRSTRQVSSEVFLVGLSRRENVQK